MKCFAQGDQRQAQEQSSRLLTPCSNTLVGHAFPAWEELIKKIKQWQTAMFSLCYNAYQASSCCFNTSSGWRCAMGASQQMLTLLNFASRKGKRQGLVCPCQGENRERETCWGTLQHQGAEKCPSSTPQLNPLGFLGLEPKERRQLRWWLFSVPGALLHPSHRYLCLKAALAGNLWSPARASICLCTC